MLPRLLLASALCLASCGDKLTSTQVPYAPPKLDDDTATVIFVQQGGFVDWRILADDHRFLGKLQRKSWFETKVTPGRHRFHAFHPDGIAYSPDGFCLGLDAELAPGKLYIVLVRFISPSTGKMEALGMGGVQEANFVIDDLVNEGQNPGVPLAPTEYGFRFRFLSKREQVGMDGAGFLSARARLHTEPQLGQQEIDGFMAAAKERQRENPILRFAVESKETTWDAIPAVCSTVTNDLALAADAFFDRDELDRRPGKRVSIDDVSKVDVAALAERECGAGVRYALDTRRRGDTQQTKKIEERPGERREITTTSTSYVTRGELVCDGSP